MTYEQKVQALARCIWRALYLSGGLEDPSNHAYWETREACGEVARREGVRVQDYIGFYDRSLRGSRKSLSDVQKMPEPPFWEEVASPRLLLPEVLES